MKYSTNFLCSYATIHGDLEMLLHLSFSMNFDGPLWCESNSLFAYSEHLLMAKNLKIKNTLLVFQPQCY